MDIPDPVLDELIRQGKEEERREKTKIRLERLTVAGVFIYAGIAAFQWCAMLVANRNSEKALEVTERAYVNVATVELGRPFRVGTVPEAIIKYKNSGLTPASHVWVGFSGGFLNSRLPPELQTKMGGLDCTAKQHVGGILPANIEDSISTDMSQELGIRLPPDVNQLLSNDTSLAVKDAREF